MQRTIRLTVPKRLAGHAAAERFANLVELLRDAFDAAVDGHREEPEVLAGILDEVHGKVMVALGDTWVPEVLPHCAVCAQPLDEVTDRCANPECEESKEVL